MGWGQGTGESRTGRVSHGQREQHAYMFLIAYMLVCPQGISVF